MDFFTRTDADDVDLCIRDNRIGKVNDLGTGDLRHEDLAAFHLIDAAHHKADALLERQPEARHALIGDGNSSTRTLLEEERHHGTPAPHNVPIADARIT